MSYSVKILADSVAPCGKRLTTFELTYPRFVHAEFLTHRMFSRNSASSRAIPIERMIQRVLDDPVMPVWWGKNQKGMQAEEELTGVELERAKESWIAARYNAVKSAQYMSMQGVHKQIVNRLLEPWMWITVICSATEYGNFFNLRCHPAAQPEIRKLAEMMWGAYSTHEPQQLEHGEWHRPLVSVADVVEAVADYGTEDAEKRVLNAISVGRCARVSYLTHDGKRDFQADIDLHDRLLASGHMSPFEHVAMACREPWQTSNFIGWAQYRKWIPNENRPEYYGGSDVPTK